MSHEGLSVQAEVAGADNPLGISALGFVLFGGQSACPLTVTQFDPNGAPVPAVSSAGSAVVGIRPDLIVTPGVGSSQLSEEAYFNHLAPGPYTVCAYVLNSSRKVIPECTIAPASGNLSARSKLPLQTHSLCYPPGTQGVNVDGTISYATYFDMHTIHEEACSGGHSSLAGAVVSLSHDPHLFYKVSHISIFPPDAKLTWSVPNITEWQPAPGGLMTISASLNGPGSVSFLIDTKDSARQGLSFAADFSWFETAERFRIAPSGVQSSIWSDGSVALAIPLQNVSDSLAAAVTLTDVAVPGGARLAPELPLALGDLPPDEIRKLDARFSSLKAGTPYRVRVRGTYASGRDSCAFHVEGPFTPAPNDNTPVLATPGTIRKRNAWTTLYPPYPLPPPPEREFNATGLLPPLGQPRNLFQTPPSSTAVVPAGQRAQTKLDPAHEVVFTRNTLVDTYSGFPPDPSEAGNTADDVVMYTANTAVSYSVDGGQTFKTVNLVGLVDPAIPDRNAFFPQDFGGLCCDQVLTYVPSANLFVWLLQYWPQQTGTDAAGKPITGPGMLRIAWASPTDIRNDFLHAWSWVDLSSAAVGLGNDWMDYPDLSFSNNWVYVGVDHAIANTGSVYTNRHVYARLSLPDITNAASSTVGYWYMDPTRGGLFQNHIVESSTDTFFFTAMPDTSTLTVYAWPDSSGSATPHDIPISSFSNADYSAPTPEGIDWNAAPKMILGATRVQPLFLCPPEGCSNPTRFLYFGFSAGRSGAGRPFPYVRVEKVDLDRFALVSEYDIWNPGFAFSTASLTSRPGNYNDEVAVSLGLGGGGGFANNAVGFLGDYVVYTTTNSDTTHAGYNRDNSGNIINDSAGNPTYAVRYGDYFSMRNSIGPLTPNGRGVGYSTVGYSAKTATAGQKWVDVGGHLDLRYVQFGRPNDLLPNPPPPPPK